MAFLSTSSRNKAILPAGLVTDVQIPVISDGVGLPVL